eukprot:CAMPEP_0198662578 /NCGR_PEP_ID=MMETSP1467-20131203/48172_1 /TAXON_ID=1462469 /ORGANISM="unid. sp., Strain CCMP2135" /LENGTH=317 /DNA_ID=CAMNT_0044399075 /DNA_START=42 /DNA_END=995 /DNA_ORIENTATION=+
MTETSSAAPAVARTKTTWAVALEEVKETLEDLQEKSAFQILGTGFVSGMVVTAVLNPYDRALFLSVRAKRPFLQMENWRRPFDGVGQTLVSRSLSTGLYFPLEELGHRLVQGNTFSSSFFAGNFAGFVNALLLSPLAAVKYMSWGSSDSTKVDGDNRRSMYRAAVATWRRGGIPAFFTGFSATVARDMTFGATFASLRRQTRLWLFGDPTCASLPHWQCFLADATAAGIAAVGSGPFNYARNQQFAHHSLDSPPPSIASSLTYFWTNLTARDGLYAKARYAQTRLMIGWGTLRVAAGMGLSSLCYQLLSELNQQKPQ